MGEATGTVWTRCEAETAALGQELGRIVAPGTVIGLAGPLGAGKTSLVRGILRGLGVTGPVTSPSFVLVREYHGRLRAYHWDVYRLGGADDLCDLPLDEHAGGNGVLLVEWADRVAAALPSDTVWIDIARPDPDRPGDRRITFSGGDSGRLVAEVTSTERSRH